MCRSRGGSTAESGVLRAGGAYVLERPSKSSTGAAKVELYASLCAHYTIHFS